MYFTFCIFCLKDKFKNQEISLISLMFVKLLDDIGYYHKCKEEIKLIFCNNQENFSMPCEFSRPIPNGS